MTDNEFREALKVEVDLFKMEHGRIDCIGVNERAYRALGNKDGPSFFPCHWFDDARVYLSTDGDGWVVELYCDSRVRRKQWTYMQLPNPAT